MSILRPAQTAPALLAIVGPLAVAMVVVGPVTVASAAITTVTACGQQFKGQAVLAGDLDCTGQPVEGVEFIDNGTLDLAGFTLTGEVFGRVGHMKIVGPGTITGPGFGVHNRGNIETSKVVVVGATISGNASTGVLTDGDFRRAPAAAEIIDSTITNNGGAGVVVSSIAKVPFTSPREPLRVLRSVVEGNVGVGLSADRVRVRDSSVSQNGGGISVSTFQRRSVVIVRSSVDDNLGDGIRAASGCCTPAKVACRDSSISGNVRGVVLQADAENPSTLRLARCTVDSNEVGIEARLRALRVTDGSVSDNALIGLSVTKLAPNQPRPAKIAGSVLTGNGTSPDCGVTEVCADIDSDIAPSLRRDTMCGTSHVLGSGIPGSTWSVCALD